MPTQFDPNRSYSAQEVLEISKSLMDIAFKHNASGTTPTANPVYGPNWNGSAFGPMSLPGFRDGMFSTLVRPRTLSSLFGVEPSLNANEKIGVMTGVTAGSGTNPSDFCGTAITAGQLKRCVQNYVWGKFKIKSQLVNVMEIGEHNDYADYQPHHLYNQAAPQSPFLPDLMGKLDLANRPGIVLNNELFTMGVQTERSFERVLVAGNIATAPASAQPGFIREFNGLERQITTGKADFDTGIACPGVDSTVITWGTGIDQTVAGRTFPMVVRDTYFGLKEIARQVGMDGVEFVLTMPFRMFQALTYVWSCQYWTYACTTTTSQPSFTNAQDIRALQVDMQNGYYLLIDGIRVPVVVTDGIRETNASTTVITADEMFILPVMWNGMKLLRLQYKNVGSAEVTEFANYGPAPEFVPMDNGMYLMWSSRTEACKEINLAAKFRVIQDAPFLAAAINTIQYSFAPPTRSADPANTSNHFNGGASRFDGSYTVQ